MGLKSARQPLWHASVLMVLLGVLTITVGRPALRAIRPHPGAGHALKWAAVVEESTAERDSKAVENAPCTLTPLAVLPLVLCLSFVVLRLRRRAFRLATFHSRKLPSSHDPSAPSD